MHKLAVTVLGIFATAVFCISDTYAQSGTGLFICRNGTLAPGETLVQKLKGCGGTEAGKDPKCISVCTTDAVGGLKDGIPDKDLFINIVKTEFPAAEQAQSLERVEMCFQNQKFDKEDPTCAAIANFSVCGTKLVVETKC